MTGEIGGVGLNVDVHCSVIGRSSTYSRPDLSAINVTNHFYPKIRGHVNTDDLMCSLCLAWGKTLLRFITNFEFIFPHYDTTTVMAEWALLSDAQVQDDILNCRSLKRSKKDVTTRANYIYQNQMDLQLIRHMH